MLVVDLQKILQLREKNVRKKEILNLNSSR